MCQANHNLKSLDLQQVLEPIEIVVLFWTLFEPPLDPYCHRVAANARFP